MEGLDRWRRRFLPEIDAGGYSRHDGTVEFYQRVWALLTPDSIVLDFGAGRGLRDEDPLPFRRRLQCFRGRVHWVIGVDVDPIVETNPLLDEAHVLEDTGPLPLPDESVDLIISDFAFEHVERPEAVAAELARVLRPGGWICARTPNRHGVIAVAARLVPNRLHTLALRVLQPGKAERDTFPTRYRLNDRRTIQRLFPEPAFHDFSYTHEPEPTYTGRSRLAWSLLSAVAMLTPPSLRAMRLIFVQKGGAMDGGTGAR